MMKNWFLVATMSLVAITAHSNPSGNVLKLDVKSADKLLFGEWTLKKESSTLFGILVLKEDHTYLFVGNEETSDGTSKIDVFSSGTWAVQDTGAWSSKALGRRLEMRLLSDGETADYYAGWGQGSGIRTWNLFFTSKNAIGWFDTYSEEVAYQLTRNE